MSEELQTEFEISLPLEFFYHSVLPHLNEHGYKYTALPMVVESVTLTSLTKVNSGLETAFSLTLTTRLLESLLRETVITPYILTNHGDHRSLYHAPTWEEALKGLKHLGGTLRLYRECAPMIDAHEYYGGFIEEVTHKKRGRLPFMAYYCAVDAFRITHVFQAFFEQPCDAGEALKKFALTAGFQSLYVCIDERESSES